MMGHPRPKVDPAANVLQTLPRRGTGTVDLSALMLLFLVAASPVAAQTGDPLIGRVVEAGTNRSIEAATVELVGEGWRLTSATGTYHFDVEPGEYRLRVAAFGYTPESRIVLVEGLTVVDFELRIAPVEIDSLAVHARLIDVRGRVRDAAEDFPIVDAAIFTRSGSAEETDPHGRFRLESVPEGVPLSVRVQAFGYLPLSIVMIPEGDDTYDFHLQEDPVARRLIDAHVSRLEERIGFRWSAVMHPMNRDDLVRYAGGATIWDVLLAENRLWLDRVKCVVLDERVVGERSGPIHNTLDAARATLLGLVPEEVERLEFMAYGGRYKGTVLRVYTRDFMQRLISGRAQLVEHPQGHDINCR